MTSTSQDPVQIFEPSLFLPKHFFSSIGFYVILLPDFPPNFPNFFSVSFPGLFLLLKSTYFMKWSQVILSPTMNGFSHCLHADTQIYTTSRHLWALVPNTQLPSSHLFWMTQKLSKFNVLQVEFIIMFQTKYCPSDFYQWIILASPSPHLHPTQLFSLNFGSHLP